MTVTLTSKWHKSRINYKGLNKQKERGSLDPGLLWDVGIMKNQSVCLFKEELIAYHVAENIVL